MEVWQEEVVKELSPEKVLEGDFEKEEDPELVPVKKEEGVEVGLADMDPEAEGDKVLTPVTVGDKVGDTVTEPQAEVEGESEGKPVPEFNTVAVLE